MKKNLLGWLAMATMLVGTGCSSDEVVNDYSLENAIQFSTYLGRDAQGRGIVLADTNLNDFGVFASYTNETEWNNVIPNFMYNQKVELKSSIWDYNPKKYWPTNQGDRISFWAYAPYATAGNGIEIVSNNMNAGVPILKYSIKSNNLLNQADFATDVEMNQTRNADKNPDGDTRSVHFNLRHELTRVNIKANLDKDIDTTTIVNIKKITFGGADLATIATYTFSDKGDGRGTWNKKQNGTLDVDVLLAKTEPTTFGEYKTPGVFVSSYSSVSSLFKTGEYLFLIPFADGIVTENVTMTIEYDIVTSDATLNGGHSLTSATKVITIPQNQVLLKQGYAYVFNLKFYMNEITLSAKIDTWQEEHGYDDNVDWNDIDKV